MKSQLLTWSLMAVLLAAVTGCYSTIEGRKRPGVPFAKDTIEGKYERPVETVFAAARKVLEFNGTLRSEDTINRTLEAKVDTRSVWVQVEEFEPNLTRVIVQARTKGGRGDVDLAAEIEKQIALQLK